MSEASGKSVQAWLLDSGSHRHRVEVAPAGLSRILNWSVDGRPVAEKKTSDDTVVLAPAEEPDANLGAVRLKFSALGRPRRVTWFEIRRRRSQDELKAELKGLNADRAESGEVSSEE